MSERIDEFFADHTPRLCDAVAAEFALLLEPLQGQQVYAAAIAHADGDAWRLDLNTTAAIDASLAEEDEGVDDEVDWAAYYRWWPDEWDALDDVSIEGEPPTRACRDEWHEFHRTVGEDEWPAFVAATVEALVTALGSPQTRAVFAAAGSSPVLVVNETDGELDTAYDSVQRLNQGHPDQALLADALAYWGAEAGDDR